MLSFFVASLLFCMFFLEPKYKYLASSCAISCQWQSLVTTDFLVKSCYPEIEPEALEPNQHDLMFLCSQLQTDM